MIHVRNAWHVAAWSSDIAAEKPSAISILGEPVVIWRSASGTIQALEDRCVHRLAPLSLGRCEGESLRCMYHGLLFGPDGVVQEIPGQELIPARARVRSYPVADRHDWIWVWMGDPALADEALIPPAVGISEPEWILGHGQLDYAAEARLICDNLLDFSHLTYVHAQSFGAGPEFAEHQPKITPLERGVRVSRWIPAPANSPRNPHDVAVEAYQTYDFLVPGVLLMWSGNYPEGTAARLGDLAPEMADALSGLNFTSQAVTSTGPGTARYFFSWGPHCRDGDDAKRDMMMVMAGQAFAEDKTMIEAQQRVIAATPDPQIMPTAHDRAVTLYNRLVERLARDNPAELESAA
ncbi:aromatic ring-hydroxylating dioxygenase subunit alpha [Novosphingobium sp. AAP93]|uniref:aromatic ring-hydroxylating dioxygenase subunit alpha n=1 Tax=Novosphingobium sp. AAP93 TaxID=1523427 RepID=UPI0006B8A9C6|nr:aromatic ring-hydroxylating dioxygenase subunit alpha [Novosphingobium sp. AAP93]KPF82137.1 (2Fe-2S)-binding protein [Novosphingobium sp. AAP93]